MDFSPPPSLPHLRINPGSKEEMTRYPGSHGYSVLYSQDGAKGHRQENRLKALGKQHYSHCSSYPANWDRRKTQAGLPTACQRVSPFLPSIPTVSMYRLCRAKILKMKTEPERRKTDLVSCT